MKNEKAACSTPIAVPDSKALSPVLGGEGLGEGRVSHAEMSNFFARDAIPPHPDPFPRVQGRGASEFAHYSE